MGSLLKVKSDKESLDWLYFINSKSEEGMKMLTEKIKIYIRIKIY
ncbi:hypothetical protein CNEO2_20117 [Clostridium neonatale]|uniref:FERM domain-containing protein n=1 Tax=Clostridium neonatale TaxID=137838 RepID=A0AAD2DH65_9CLOT|nr:hypothetical protein CNEO2_510026 [Clostridium neonatale]CAI3214414.1 hypothetical protein CNEO2_90048 [Clostridium neonatale]CAI3215101.1 hypothetical protein CNEO2_70079 [Clostridium neonatale]CAI3561075.1 hypothetical protein CNEO4_120076 [Clostridium neonatale]CAI3614150.1 hypothetical protein CNEO4_210026 [Clostridium neonatale]